MDYRNLNIAAGKTQTLQSTGQGFRYESGASTTSDAYIIVKSETGSEVPLKPGQQFRINAECGNWTVRANDAAAVITGRVVIFGKDEDFEDSNTNNTFKLDGTFTNEVKVNNTGENPVPVSISGGALEVSGAVSIEGTATVQENLFAYTGSYINDQGLATNTAVEIVSAAANTAGITVHNAFIQDASTNHYAAFLAKSGAAPTSVTNGEAVLFSIGYTDSKLVTRLTNKIKIPAGKALYLITDTTAVRVRSITYTVH